MTSFRSTKPQIDRISFRRHDFLTINLEDGRILSVPLSRFPNIAKLTSEQRRKYHIADGIALMFPGDDEVYHIDDFMGSNSIKMPSENDSVDREETEGKRILASFGTAVSLIHNESIFRRLTDHWESKSSVPVDLLFQKSPIEAVVYRLQRTDERLRFSQEIIAGELHGVKGLTGFAAKSHKVYWVILPAEIPSTYRNVILNILTVAIGLDYLYSSSQELIAEAERVALAALLPEAEVRNFFSIRLSRFPDAFQNEVSAYFNVPFEYVLKRAIHIGAVDEERIQVGEANRQSVKKDNPRRYAA